MFSIVFLLHMGQQILPFAMTFLLAHMHEKNQSEIIRCSWLFWQFTCSEQGIFLCRIHAYICELRFIFVVLGLYVLNHIHYDARGPTSFSWHHGDTVLHTHTHMQKYSWSCWTWLVLIIAIYWILLPALSTEKKRMPQRMAVIIGACGEGWMNFLNIVLEGKPSSMQLEETLRGDDQVRTQPFEYLWNWCL